MDIGYKGERSSRRRGATYPDFSAHRPAERAETNGEWTPQTNLVHVCIPLDCRSVVSMSSVSLVINIQCSLML